MELGPDFQIRLEAYKPKLMSIQGYSFEQKSSQQLIDRIANRKSANRDKDVKKLLGNKNFQVRHLVLIFPEKNWSISDL